MAEIAEVAGEAIRATLWDDNPATEDLLGFDSVVAPIVTALRQPNLDPITIGVHSPWGGGKSTILNLLEAHKDQRWVIVRTNPWEYEDQLDVKGTLIAEVLAALRADLGLVDEKLEQFDRLLGRIQWSRVGIALTKGVITMNWNPVELAKAFRPNVGDGPQSLGDFRKEYEKLLLEWNDVDRVVVLVDDLDRCLPAAVLASLEAIKLFLSVRKMVFVIAADQDMVRDAIAASLAGTGRSEQFADRYLEKIVQLPVALPRLSPVDAEAYVGLLLTRAENGEAGFPELVAHCIDRRRRNLAPLLAGLDGLANQPSDATLQLAAQLTEGLEPSKRGNPREIKRFLNAFGVRSQIAASRGLEGISPAIVVKLLLLEDRYRPDFDRLVGTPESDRADLLRRWEAWGRNDAGAERPEGVSEPTRSWAGAEPRLTDEDLGPYLTLAATIAASTLGGGLTDELRAIVRKLLDESQTLRKDALDDAKKRTPEERRRVGESLLAESRRVDDKEVEHVITALVELGKEDALSEGFAAGIREHLWRRIPEVSVVDLARSGVPSFRQVVTDLAEDDTVDGTVREAAKIALETD
jgi:hypothetical protein